MKKKIVARFTAVILSAAMLLSAGGGAVYASETDSGISSDIVLEEDDTGKGSYAPEPGSGSEGTSEPADTETTEDLIAGQSDEGSDRPESDEPADEAASSGNEIPEDDVTEQEDEELTLQESASGKYTRFLFSCLTTFMEDDENTLKMCDIQSGNTYGFNLEDGDEQLYEVYSKDRLEERFSAISGETVTVSADKISYKVLKGDSATSATEVTDGSGPISVAKSDDVLVKITKNENFSKSDTNKYYFQVTVDYPEYIEGGTSITLPIVNEPDVFCDTKEEAYAAVRNIIRNRTDNTVYYGAGNYHGYDTDGYVYDRIYVKSGLFKYGSISVEDICDFSAERDGMAPYEGDYMYNLLGNRFQRTFYYEGPSCAYTTDDGNADLFGTTYRNGDCYYIYEVYLPVITTLEEENELDSKVADLMSGTFSSVKDGTNEEKIRAVYDYIVSNVKGTVSGEGGGDRTYPLYHTAYHALIKGNGTCEAFAQLFTRLTRELGVPSKVIMGVDANNHTYNIVDRGDGYWYFIDTNSGRYLTDSSFSRTKEQERYQSPNYIVNYWNKIKGGTSYNVKMISVLENGNSVYASLDPEEIHDYIVAGLANDDSVDYVIKFESDWTLEFDQYNFDFSSCEAGNELKDFSSRVSIDLGGHTLTCKNDNTFAVNSISSGTFKIGYSDSWSSYSGNVRLAAGLIKDVTFTRNVNGSRVYFAPTLCTAAASFEFDNVYFKNLELSRSESNIKGYYDDYEFILVNDVTLDGCTLYIDDHKTKGHPVIISKVCDGSGNELTSGNLVLKGTTILGKIGDYFDYDSDQWRESNHTFIQSKVEFAVKNGKFTSGDCIIKSAGTIKKYNSDGKVVSATVWDLVDEDLTYANTSKVDGEEVELKAMGTGLTFAEKYCSDGNVSLTINNAGFTNVAWNEGEIGTRECTLSLYEKNDSGSDYMKKEWVYNFTNSDPGNVWWIFVSEDKKSWWSNWTYKYITRESGTYYATLEIKDKTSYNGKIYKSNEFVYTEPEEKLDAPADSSFEVVERGSNGWGRYLYWDDINDTDGLCFGYEFRAEANTKESDFWLGYPNKQYGYCLDNMYNYLGDGEWKISIRAISKDINTKTTGDWVEYTCNMTEQVLARELRMSQNALTLYTGGGSDSSANLTAVITPDDTTMTGISWKSSNEEVAKVDVNDNFTATVTAVGNGTATITATTYDSARKSATCKVTVKTHATSIDLDPVSMNLAKGKSAAIKAAVDSDATDKTVKWTTSDASIATVDKNGKVTGVDPGEAIITATADSGDGISAETKVSVFLPAEEVHIYKYDGNAEKYRGADVTKQKVGLDLDVVDDPETTEIDEGRNTVKLSTGVFGKLSNGTLSEDTVSQSLTWKSAKDTIATVEENDDNSVTVTARGQGTTTITATATDGTNKSASITVVVSRLVQEIKVSGATEVAQGKSITLTAAVTPDSAANKAVTWSEKHTYPEDFDENELAKVKSPVSIDAKGKLTVNAAVPSGTTINVNAIAADGSGVVSDVHEVTVFGVTGQVLIKDGLSVGDNDITKSNLTLDLSSETANTIKGVCLEKSEYDSDDNRAKVSQSVTYTNGNAKVVALAVNNDGSATVTPVAAGKATVTVTAADGSGIKNTVTFTVVKTVTNIDVTGPSNIAAGKAAAFTAAITPADATNKKITWAFAEEEAIVVPNGGFDIYSSIKNPVTINASNGRLTVHKDVPAGTTIKIKAIAQDTDAKESNTVMVTVQEPATRVEILKDETNVTGQKLGLDADVLDDSSTDGDESNNTLTLSAKAYAGGRNRNRRRGIYLDQQ